ALQGARLPLAVVLLLCPVGASTFANAQQVLSQPQHAAPGEAVEETRTLIRAFLLPRLRAGDAIYVYYGSVAAFQYYAPAFLRPHDSWNDYQRFQHDGITVGFGASHRAAVHRYGAEVRALRFPRHTRRIWLVFAHITAGAG